ncbi:DUF2203 domain-containing protein [Paenibacillus daejeonensis]|uniref:DUF2203 domain-containing protein n=1 Tax=Paenibacillus daejeonensis TaxID=135193 RepID=UPI00035D61A2|nr:DUF2203 domain-containing protein [Paenibacillus daejeonensis]
MVQKRFTLEEATAMLPELCHDLQVVQAVTQELQKQYVDLQKIKARYKQTQAAGVKGGGAADPFFELEARLDFLQIEAEVQIANFARKGVLLKMISPGLIDFPAVIDGQEVLICWKEGEERITHYHGWHDGYSGRKPLPEET